VASLIKDFAPLSVKTCFVQGFLTAKPEHHPLIRTASLVLFFAAFSLAFIGAWFYDFYYAPQLSRFAVSVRKLIKST
jgi:hypothetical protein